ncbi:hypothetical protein K438DRAFT_1764562 [Mycena galopus ATCC 62051]|nr:hypothetical protein K438DRAFT_1764562 [Mycena galopus ATCC 62051]
MSVQAAPLLLSLTLFRRLTSASVAAATRNWGPENFDVMYAVTVKYLLHQKPSSLPVLSNIRCPISLVHCSKDIVYPLSSAEEIRILLHEANIPVTLSIFEGAPHFGNVTHINETNTLLYDFVLANSSPAALPTPPTFVQSPFTEELAAFGLLDEDEAD